MTPAQLRECTVAELDAMRHLVAAIDHHRETTKPK